MTMPQSIHYIDAKGRVNRVITKLHTFVKASVDYNNERGSVSKRAKIRQMLSELSELRQQVEDDVQVMETAVGQKTAPVDVTNNQCSSSLIESFDTLFYELAAFADVHSFSISKSDSSASNITVTNQSSGFNNLSMFQLPKRKVPTFSGKVVDWQGFEELFKSILSHAPELPDVERFEIQKTSLEGEALSLISHLALTSANYQSAWDLLRMRYGNKRDLSRIHLDALLNPSEVKWNDSSLIKTAITTILEHTSALDNLDFVTRQWSPILIHLYENQLDYELRSRWELIVGDKQNPQMNEFIEFLRNHVRSAGVHQLQGSATSCPSTKAHSKSPQPNSYKSRYGTSQKVLSATSSQATTVCCPLCRKSHSVRQCQLFTDQIPSERFKVAKTHQLCINCLGPGHSPAACRSKYKFQTCHKSHHTLLHFDASTRALPGPSEAADRSVVNCNTASLSTRGQRQSRVVLLSTILLDVDARDGSRQPLRALVDSGSQASFITEKSACSLMLHRNRSLVNISSFNSTTCTPVRGKSVIVISPSGRITPSVHVEVLIVPQITECTPQRPLVPGNWPHIVDLQLADSSYHTPGEIDILLGADILPSLLLQGKIDGQEGDPMAIETFFGWILLGPVNLHSQPNTVSLCLSISESLDKTLKAFWELEELPSVPHLSSDDLEAETFYKSSTTRLASGRFMVRLPFRKPLPLLGDSKAIALQRLKALELRLGKNEDLCKQYVEFMQDYLTAGHMEVVSRGTVDTVYKYYLPHHCVLNPDSTSTKLRVVFNASAQTTTGVSLNESMYVGPKLQPDIRIVLLRARLWKYVLVADIKQMYRQILVHPDDRDYQRILWRFSCNSPIEEYRLCTVTYCTSAAPFQALRTIRELAMVDGATCPRAATILLNDTFVDDVLTGANTISEALECQ